jgi:predicted ATPase
MESPGISSRPLVGRVAELRTLRECIGAAIAGDGRRVLITGPRGIGKSRLLDEAAVFTRERGAIVHRARCWEEGGAPAFWPWTQILRSAGKEARFSLTSHLDRCLKTGARCSYEAIQPKRWIL